MRSVLERLLAKEYELFETRHPGSHAAYRAARLVLPLGVGSSFQHFDPYPVTIARADGPYAFDVDGNRFLDLNMGFGALMVGHRHPHVLAAVERQLTAGTLFVAPSSLGEQAAALLAERFQHPLWRFTNSGTEATMTAVRLARAHTGRPLIVKIEGGYHGHADTLLVSGKPPLNTLAAPPRPLPDSLGVPAGVLADVLVVPFNDPQALERVLSEHPDRVAGFILEPALENAGIVLPQPGYLEEVRNLCDRFGVLLIFDEVKTGLTAAWGGAAEMYGVRPDITCLAKSIGGGFPVGAFGGREDVMRTIEKGCTHQGTYNANPLVLAATIAALEVTTRQELRRTHVLNERFAGSVDDLLAPIREAVPTCVQTLGSKGSVTFTTSTPVDYRDWKNSDMLAAELFWLYSTNRGVLTPPGLDEQWLVSLAHDDASLEIYLAQLSDLCEVLARSADR